MAAAQLGHDRHARALGHGPVLILARQQTGGQRRKRQETYILVHAQLGHVGVIEAAHQRILVLNRRHTRPVALLRKTQPLRRAPGAFVGQAKGADRAACHFALQSLQSFVHMGQRLLTVLAGRIVTPILPEHVTAAIGPVKLVEVDMIGLQPPERGFDRLGDRPGGNRRPIARALVPGAGMLGGQNHIAAPTGACEPGADDLFGATSGFRPNGIDRIHFGGVDKVDAMVERQVDLGVALILRGSVCPRSSTPGTMCSL